ncbi:DUF7522 family protein [Halobacterium litoreum]|uniref:Uncharacterized protein n=1 Tax=Halobacterium litoreum TaxID=2039234 RepID=A0ABD5NB34_9EURY|nr:hypothetical protein [Halobacterium litoreum]UHH12137.1 hypothetical protein LT972_08205 [Halobacterium litoreum]
MSLEARIRDALGDGVRTVGLAWFAESEYEIRYMREDIGQQYSKADMERIYQDLGIGGFAKQIQDELYEPLGDFRVTVQVFDHGLNVVRWNEAGSQALFLGLDRDRDLILDAIDATEDVFPLPDPAA